MIPSDFHIGMRVRYGQFIGIAGHRPPSEQPTCYVHWPDGGLTDGYYPLQWLEVVEPTKEEERV